MIKKLNRLLAVLLMVVVAGDLCAREVIKVGVVAPMSGNMAFMGEGLREGISLAQSVLMPDANFDYKFIYEDDEFVYSKTAAAVRKLKDVDKVNVVITLWGYGSSIALPILKDSGIVHLSAHRWANSDAKLDFSTGESVQSQSEEIINYLSAMGYTRVACMSTAEQGAKTMRKELEKRFENTNIEMVADLAFPDTTRDFRTALLKIQNKDPDIILQFMTFPGNSIVLAQKKDLAIDIPVLNSSSSVFDIDPDLVEGSVTVYAKPALPEWDRSFVEQMGHEPKYPASYVYNTVLLLVKSLETLQADQVPSGGEIAHAIASLGSFEGSTGRVDFVAPNRYESPIVYGLFKDGKVHVMELDEIVRETKK